MKRCGHCKELKTLDMFGKHRGTVDGLNPRCKACHNAASKQKRQQLVTSPFNGRQITYGSLQTMLVAERNPLYKHRMLLSNLLREALFSKLQRTSYRIEQHLGCSVIELRAQLEAQFQPGMSWQNYGEWEVDHIVPCSTAKTLEELHVLQHHSNLRPLWRTENRSK